MRLKKGVCEMRETILLGICLVGVLTCYLFGSDSLQSTGISQVSVSRTSFNPVLGQTVSLSMKFCCRGTLNISVRDRDSFIVRHLVQKKAVESGMHSELWDGKDDQAVLLPNEAYTFRIELQTSEGMRVYDPADHFTPILESGSNPTYSRVRAILHYTIKQSSRVHVQVGIAKPAAKTGVMIGAVLANPVDSEPRPAGSVIETWNGFLKNTDIFVPDNPDFFVGVLASSLAENSVIISGNSNSTFREYAKHHRQFNEIQARDLSKADYSHHRGLNAFEDHSPELHLEILNSIWKGDEKLWNLSGDAKVRVEIDKDQAAYFLSQPSEVQIYVDDKLVARQSKITNPVEIPLPSGGLPSGEHLLTANWVSAFGPVGVATVRIAITGSIKGGRK
jgi:hypothetical protein